MGQVFAHDGDTRSLICAIQENNWGSPSLDPFIKLVSQQQIDWIGSIYVKRLIRKAVSSRLLGVPAVERRMNNILDLAFWAPRNECVSRFEHLKNI